MTLNKIENFFLFSYIYLAPFYYFQIPVSLFGGNFKKIIELILLGLFAFRILIKLELPSFPKIGIGNFITYVAVASFISLFFAVPFANSLPDDLALITQPIPRFIVQMGSLITMVSVFYYAYRFAKKNGIKFQKHLFIVFSIVICAGIYQFIAFYMGLPYWGISMSRDFIVTFSSGFIRVNSLVGEPKGLASFILLFAIPFLLFRNNITSRWFKFLGYSSLVLLLFTFSTSGYFTFVLGLFVSAYVAFTKYRAQKSRFYSVISSFGLVVTILVLVIILVPAIRGVLFERIDRLGAMTGLSQDPGAFSNQVYLMVPIIGEAAFSVIDAMPLAFLLDNPWVVITGVGDGMISIYAREYFGAYHGWFDIGYGGVIGPSVGIIKHLADWGIIGISLFGLIIYRVVKRASRILSFDDISISEKNALEFWSIAVIGMALFIINIGNGYTGLLLPGLVIGYSDFLKNKYNLR